MIIYPRKKLDYSYTDLLAAMGCTIHPMLNKKKIIGDLKALWSSEKSVVSFSVRTTFDALLHELDFPVGSEVIMTGINIPDMVHIVHAHGLQVVPIDMEISTLQVQHEEIVRALSPRTVIIVVAPLFGTHMDMDPVFEALKNHPEIIVVEDCAQAFCGIEQYLGDPRSDVSLFSFGSIKTASALGCSLGRFKDQNLQTAIMKVLSGYEHRHRLGFAIRIIKYFFLKILSEPMIYGLFVTFSNIFKADYDALIISAVRNFDTDELLGQIRSQPCLPQLAFLRYRLKRIHNDQLQGRIDAGNYVQGHLNDSLNVYGSGNKTHTYWLFPVRCSDRKTLIKELIAHGFDATYTSTQLQAITPDMDIHSEPPNCTKYMAETVYLPVHDGVPPQKLEKLVAVVNSIPK